MISKIFCATANAVSFFENRHFRSHRPPRYDGSKILCVDKIHSRPRRHLCVEKIGSGRGRAKIGLSVPFIEVNSTNARIYFDKSDPDGVGRRSKKKCGMTSGWRTHPPARRAEQAPVQPSRRTLATPCTHKKSLNSPR